MDPNPFHDRRDLPRALNLFREMKNRYSIEPNLDVYNRLIEAYIKASDFEGVLPIMEEMRQAGLTPNKMTVFQLEGCIHAANVIAAGTTSTTRNISEE